MQEQPRRRRFIVVPKDGLADTTSTPAQTLRLMQLRPATAPLADLDLKVVNTSPPDGAVLVEADHASITQIKAITDRFGHARFKVSAKTTRLETLYVDPLHGGWPVALDSVAHAEPGLDVDVPAIDLKAEDARGLVSASSRKATTRPRRSRSASRSSRQCSTAATSST